MTRRRQSTFPLVERHVGPRLRMLLADTSRSLPAIAEILRVEHDIHVSSETLRRWANELDVPPRPNGGQRMRMEREAS